MAIAEISPHSNHDEEALRIQMLMNLSFVVGCNTETPQRDAPFSLEKYTGFRDSFEYIKNIAVKAGWFYEISEKGYMVISNHSEPESDLPKKHVNLGIMTHLDVVKLDNPEQGNLIID